MSGEWTTKPDDPTASLIASLPKAESFPILGRYALCRLLGAGGAGAVYMGYHVRLQRPVAVKILNPILIGAGEAAVQRFQREAILTSKLSSPNIVSVTDAGSHHDPLIHYIVMDFVDGENAEERVARLNRPLTPMESCSVVLDTSRGLAAAHSADILHRDLKPANIMISRKGDVRLADLGIATSREQPNLQVTQGDEFVGTPQYMAPEHVRGEELDERADVYSLGVTLYFLITGVHPFDAPNAYSVMQRVESEALPDPRSIAPDIPAPLAQLLEGATARDREDRIPSAEALSARLEMIVNRLGGRADLADLSAGGPRSERVVELSTTQLSSIAKATDSIEQQREQPPKRSRMPALIIAVLVLITAGAGAYIGLKPMLSTPLRVRVVEAAKEQEFARLVQLLSEALEPDAMPDPQRRAMLDETAGLVAGHLESPLALFGDAKENKAHVVGLLCAASAQGMTSWLSEGLIKLANEGRYSEIVPVIDALERYGRISPDVLAEISAGAASAIVRRVSSSDSVALSPEEKALIDRLDGLGVPTARHLIVVASVTPDAPMGGVQARRSLEAADALGLEHLVTEPVIQGLRRSAVETTGPTDVGVLAQLSMLAGRGGDHGQKALAALESLFSVRLSSGDWDDAARVWDELAIVKKDDRAHLAALGDAAMTAIEASVERGPLGTASTPTGEPHQLLARLVTAGVRNAALWRLEFMIEWGLERDQPAVRPGISDADRGSITELTNRAISDARPEHQLRANFVTADLIHYDIITGGSEDERSRNALSRYITCVNSGDADSAARILEMINDLGFDVIKQRVEQHGLSLPEWIVFLHALRATVDAPASEPEPRALCWLGYLLLNVNEEGTEESTTPEKGIELMLRSSALDFGPARDFLDRASDAGIVTLTDAQKRRAGLNPD